MGKHVVIKIGTDPKYWVERFQDKETANAFIDDQIQLSPGKYNYVLAHVKAEILDRR